MITTKEVTDSIGEEIRVRDLSIHAKVPEFKTPFWNHDLKLKKSDPVKTIENFSADEIAEIEARYNKN